MYASVRDDTEDIGGTGSSTVAAGRWVSTADDVCRALAANDTNDTAEPLQQVVERLLAAADADLVTLVGPVAGGSVAVAAAAGAEARHWQGITVPAEGTLAESILRSGEARLVVDVVGQLGDNVRPITGVTCVMAVPLRNDTGVRAVLTIGRGPERPAFTATDLALAGLLAGQVALALNHRDERARLERTVLAGERDRIAAGMQHQVIAPLFALGMTLQGAAGRASGAAAQHLESGSDEIDETIKAIRATIYSVAD